MCPDQLDQSNNLSMKQNSRDEAAILWMALSPCWCTVVLTNALLHTLYHLRSTPREADILITPLLLKHFGHASAHTETHETKVLSQGNLSTWECLALQTKPLSLRSLLCKMKTRSLRLLQFKKKKKGHTEVMFSRWKQDVNKLDM